MKITDGAARRTLRRKLLRWFEHNRRDLPWRSAPDNAYHQWLAEIMLQQTQVATVVPYFEKFLERFPTVEHLAEAPLDDVMRLWAGLGYYTRARNLHQCARIVARELHGRFPDTVEGLQSLPGVGRYTAGAIASIAFGRPAPVVDGNVKRVLCRLFLIEGDVTERNTIEQLWTIANHILPRRRCGDFNQALMELGATVCLPRNPKCQACPLARNCSAFAADVAASLPRASVRARPKEMKVVVAAIQHREKYLIRRRDHDTLWGGLWELPSAELNGHSSGRAALLTLLDQLRPGLGETLRIPTRPCGRITHRLTHRIVRIGAYLCTSRPDFRPLRSRRDLKWISRGEFGDYAFATAQQRIIKLVTGDRETASHAQ